MIVDDLHLIIVIFFLMIFVDNLTLFMHFLTLLCILLHFYFSFTYTFTYTFPSEAMVGRYQYDSLVPLFLAFINLSVTCLIVGVLATIVHIRRQEYAAVYWRSYYSGFAAAAFLIMHALIFFLRDRVLLPTLPNAMSFFLLAWSLAIGVGLIGGFISFHASQRYILALFGHIGNVEGVKESFLTLNGMRYDPIGAQNTSQK